MLLYKLGFLAEAGGDFLVRPRFGRGLVGLVDRGRGGFFLWGAEVKGKAWISFGKKADGG